MSMQIGVRIAHDAVINAKGIRHLKQSIPHDAHVGHEAGFELPDQAH